MDKSALTKETFVDDGLYDEGDLDFVIPHVSYLCFLQAVRHPENQTVVDTCARRFIALSESGLEFNSACPYVLLDECLEQMNWSHSNRFLEDGEEVFSDLLRVYVAYDAITTRITNLRLSKLVL